MSPFDQFQHDFSLAAIHAQIGLDSVLGQGSTFWFRVRFARQQGEIAGAPARPPNISGMPVLVVDDNELNRRCFDKQIGSWGCAVTLAADGEQALAALEDAVRRGAPFEVALIDQTMPGMNGGELARFIRERAEFAETRLVLAAPMSLGGDSDVVRPDDFAARLTKPVRPSALYDCLVDARYADLADDVAPAEAEEPDDAPTPVLDVLVAEDNYVNQMLTLAMLKKDGHRVDLAGNGFEAIAAARKRIYDVVLMDVNMPDMDGLEATAKIRELPGPAGRVAIVALTANAMSGDREEYLAAGMDGYVSKPIDPSALSAEIERCRCLRGSAHPTADDAQTARSEPADADEGEGTMPPYRTGTDDLI